MAELSFDAALSVGDPSVLVDSLEESSDEAGAADASVDVAPPPPAPRRRKLPRSRSQRGLSLRSLKVDKGWDGWGFFNRVNEIYFMSVGFDFSGEPPILLPPKEVPADAIYQVRKGEVLAFNLGDGAPVYPRRTITGGLVVYVVVCEADKGIQHVGEVLTKLHEDFARDDSLPKVIEKFITNPGKTVADEVLQAGTAALKPLGTILESNRDERIALFQGTYPANGSWDDHLTDTKNQTTITLAEL